MSAISYPAHLKPYPFQIDAAAFSLARDNSYLALDPGLGKTICAALVLNELNLKLMRAVYICPPFLTRDAEEKLSNWTVNGIEIKRYEQKNPPERYFRGVLIVPDSLLIRDETIAAIKRFLITQTEERILIVDEAHRFKNETAKRTRSLFKKIYPLFNRAVFMSGTPLSNRPIELFSILRNAAPETINYMNRFQYGVRYCAGFEGEWGWDFSGASNLRELASRIKPSFMLRKRKDEVLLELPDKIEELVVMGGAEPQVVRKLSQAVVGGLDDDDTELKDEFMRDLAKDQIHLATYRRMLGLAKVKEAAQRIKDLLDDSEESVIIFAIHTEVIVQLSEALKGFSPAIVTGQTPMGLRHELVRAFQNKGTRLFIGNIQAAGVGITLTAATRVIFVEASWVPAENDQAADRAHRIGQKDTVFVQYYCFRNSLDRKVLLTNFRKRKIIDHI